MAAKNLGNKSTFTLTIGGDDFDFSVGLTDFNTLQNEMMPNNKVSPSENFLMATVDDDRPT